MGLYLIQRHVDSDNNKQIREAWTKLRSEKLHDLNSLPNILAIQSRRMRWAQHWKLGNAHKVLVEKSER
jgi:hypothetical protein